MNDLVSIITPSRNGAIYLQQCLDSVLNQSYPNIEHIVVDSESTDGTLAILKEYQSQYPSRFRFISEPDNGVGEALNKGITMSRGKIIGVLSTDDLYEPRAIQSVIDFFNSHSYAHFVFGGCNLIDSDGESKGEIHTKDFNWDEIAHKECYVPTPASFYTRDTIDKVGYYIKSGNDLEFLLRVSREFSIFRIQNTLASFRIHDQSSTSGRRVAVRRRWLREDCMVSRKYGGQFMSGYCKRYYQFTIVEFLRPLFGFTYPFLKKLQPAKVNNGLLPKNFGKKYRNRDKRPCIGGWH